MVSQTEMPACKSYHNLFSCADVPHLNTQNLKLSPIITQWLIPESKALFGNPIL